MNEYDKDLSRRIRECLKLTRVLENEILRYLLSDMLLRLSEEPSYVNERARLEGRSYICQCGERVIKLDDIGSIAE